MQQESGFYRNINMIWYYSKKSTQAPGLGQERQQTDRRRFGTLWQQQPAGKRPKGRQRLPGHGPGWEECHCVPWWSALLRRQMQQALLEQIIFTWDGVADLPVVLRRFRLMLESEVLLWPIIV